MDIFFQGHIYDDQYYGSTVISEFDLACGEEWKIPFVESSSFVGIMIAAMSFGLLGIDLFKLEITYYL